jgi:hypothetical protein
MELLTSYVAIGTLFGLYGMAAAVVCEEMASITKDLRSFRNK